MPETVLVTYTHWDHYNDAYSIAFAGWAKGQERLDLFLTGSCCRST